MPRYYFHLHTIDGFTEHDEEGHDFPSDEAAIDMARTLADEAESQAKAANHPITQIIEVFDKSGRCIHRLECKGPH